MHLPVIGIVTLAVASHLLPQALGLPTMSSQRAPTPTTLIIAWFAALLAIQSGVESAWDIYATAGPRPRIVNLIRILLTGAVGAVISVSVLGNAAMTITAVSGLVGAGLLGGAVLGHRLAWVAPTSYLLVIIGAGAIDPIGSPRLWAAPGNPTPGPAEAALSSTLLLLGAIAWWRSSTRQVSLQHRD